MLAGRVGVSPPFEKQNQQRVSIRDGLIDVVIIVGTLAESDMDTLAEWLRRRPAKPMGSPRVGSNPTGVDFCMRLSLQDVLSRVRIA